MIDARSFKDAMRCFPTGVTVVTTYFEGTPHGFTANAFSSVSVDPPSVLVCVNRKARSHRLISASERFCVNILRADQAALAEHFSVGADEQFDDVPYLREDDGSPRITGSLAWFDCVLSEEHSVSTHTIFVGSVIHAFGDPVGTPLGYLRGHFHAFPEV